MRRQVAVEGGVVDAPPVTASFAVLLGRLRPGFPGLEIDPEVLVVDSPVVNAAALPGGIVAVYTGLVRQMRTPEEMAAVLAHELAHVAHRDAFTLVARQLGVAALSAIVSGRGGETVAGTVLRTALNARYSRQVEDRADAECLGVLEGAGIDPGAFADALVRLKELKEKPGDAARLLRWLDTHSPIDERIASARERSRSFAGQPRPIGIDWSSVLAALPSVFD